MKIERVELSKLAADPANVRKHNSKNLKAIEASLRRFGQQKPIVVDGDGIVRAGQVGANMQFFYQLESETGVKLKDLRPAAVAPPAKGAKSPFVPVGFSLSADGSYVQLLNLLRRIESGPRYARIVSASLSGSLSDRRSPLTLSLSVELLGLP